MRLTVVGTGYVGLVTGACFAEMGYEVCCVDNNADKIEGLRRGIVPIHEPELEPLVIRNHQLGRLRFSTSLGQEIEGSDVIFIAVGTPPGEDGSADLQHVIAVAHEIGQHLKHYCVIADKSTVPVGTAEKVRETIQRVLTARGVSIEFDVVSNPEFLKEGAAVGDFMRPERVIVGTDSKRAVGIMHELYAPFTRNHERMLTMGVRDAEMTKYAANAMLATKISFMNEIAALCDRLGVDVENVRKGIGSDSRIGYSFIYPGVGYGGSCFPKDVKALTRMANETDFDPKILQAVEARNEAQKRVLVEKITTRFGKDLTSRKFGVWGLAFKPGTDDMREAPSTVLLQHLIDAGALIRAYDPVAMETARRELDQEWYDSGRLVMAENQYDALKGVDAMILVTEWNPFRHPDLDLMRRIMNSPIIFDGRNQYDPAQIRGAGFEYSGIGR